MTPTDETLQSVLHMVITRLMKPLTRRVVLVEEEGATYMAGKHGDSDQARMLRPLQAAACPCRIAFGPRVGQKLLTVQGMAREKNVKQTLCADPVQIARARYVPLPGWSYRNMWWVTHNPHGAITARGVHGQALCVDPKALLVDARFASDPLAGHANLDPTSLPAHQALAEHLMHA